MSVRTAEKECADFRQRPRPERHCVSNHHGGKEERTPGPRAHGSEVLSAMCERPVSGARAPARRCEPGVDTWIQPRITFPELSLFSKIELSASAVQAVIIIALQSAIAGVFTNTVPANSNDPTYNSITVYLVLFILSQVYQFGLVVNAVRVPAAPAPFRERARRSVVTARARPPSPGRLCQCGGARWGQLWEQNTIQIFVHVVFNACLFAYSILQITELKSALTGGSVVDGATAYNQIFPLLVTSCVVLAVFTVFFAYLSWRLYLEFGWNIYKKIGALPAMHSRRPPRAGLPPSAARERRSPGAAPSPPASAHGMPRHVPRLPGLHHAAQARVLLF